MVAPLTDLPPAVADPPLEAAAALLAAAAKMTTALNCVAVVG